MLRKYISAGVILAVIFNSLLVYIIFFITQQSAKFSIKEQIKEDYGNLLLETLTFGNKSELGREILEGSTKEFLLNGNMYDVVKVCKCRNNISALVVNDTKEKSLINEFLNNQKANPVKNIIKSIAFQALYPVSKIYSIINYFAVQQIPVFATSSNILSNYISPAEPPPKHLF